MLGYFVFLKLWFASLSLPITPLKKFLYYFGVDLINETMLHALKLVDKIPDCFVPILEFGIFTMYIFAGLISLNSSLTHITNQL